MTSPIIYTWVKAFARIIQSARLTSTLTQVICRPVLVNTRTVPLIRPNKKPGNVAAQVLQWIAFSHRFQKATGRSLLGKLETNSAIRARRDTCISYTTSTHLIPTWRTGLSSEEV
jgi:hypothetical protein